MVQNLGSTIDDPDSDPAFAGNEFRAAEKRAELFNLIDDLIKWENSNNSIILNKAKFEIARCVASRNIETGDWAKDFQPVVGTTAWDFNMRRATPDAVDSFLAMYAPPILDPFCGGGSIPLEAQRLGMRARASDLNPVSVLVNKAIVDVPHLFKGRPPVSPEALSQLGRGAYSGIKGLTEDLRFYGHWVREEARKRIGHLYPMATISKEFAASRDDLRDYDGQKLAVIAWFWARTVVSPNPAANGAHVPLVSSFWLSKKRGRQAWVEPVINRDSNSYYFEVKTGSPTKEQAETISAGTKLGRGCKFRCLLTDQPIPEYHIKNESNKGNLRELLLAFAVKGSGGRLYLSPTPEQESMAAAVERPEHITCIDAPLAHDPRNLWCLPYGLDHFDKLFTPRQLVALTTFSDLIAEAREKLHKQAMAQENVEEDDRSLEEGGTGAAAYADAVALYLAFALSRAVDYNSSLASWRPKDNAMRSTLAKQALPMIWDYAEANPFEKSSAGFLDCIKVVSKCLEYLPVSPPGSTKQLDATSSINGVQSPLICTDPPYYDNIGYADLSDFLYVWLRRTIGGRWPNLCSTVVTPKSQELIASPYRFGGDKDMARTYFETGLGKAFSLMREKQHPEYPLLVFYAFKQSETNDDDDDDDSLGSSSSGTASTGWETMLEGLVHAGFMVTGTWPMRTEGDNRQVGLGTNALASSILLVCHPRPADAPSASRREFIGALRRDLEDALHGLQISNIAPVDLAQASIGPGMAVFSRYAKVVEADGSSMTVRTALQLINRALDEVLTEQEGEFDADTRWAIAWFEQFGIDEGPFGQADVLSRAKNTSVAGLAEAGIVRAKGGKVRLLRRDELPADYDPAADSRRTVWEVTQHLIRALDQHGEAGAAALLRQVGDAGEVARDLAYRLYTTCERKKWAQEALAYNSLVIAWPSISRLAHSSAPATPAGQGTLNYGDDAG